MLPMMKEEKINDVNLHHMKIWEERASKNSAERNSRRLQLLRTDERSKTNRIKWFQID
jgi:hypothetical protein